MDWNHLIFLQLFRKRPSWELESRSRSNWHSGTGETSSGSMLRSSWSTTIAAIIKVNLSWNSLSLSSWRTLDVLQAAMVNDPLSWTWPGPMSIYILIWNILQSYSYIFTRPSYILQTWSHNYICPGLALSSGSRQGKGRLAKRLTPGTINNHKNKHKKQSINEHRHNLIKIKGNVLMIVAFVGRLREQVRS